MAEEPNQIKHHIDTTRKELGHNLHELEHRVKDATNWRTYVNRYPLPVAGLAFATGTAIALSVGPIRRSKNGHNGRYYQPVNGQHSHQGGGYVWDLIKTTMIGLASNQIKAILNEAIPNFRQHYERIQRERMPGTLHPSNPTL